MECCKSKRDGAGTMKTSGPAQYKSQLQKLNIQPTTSTYHLAGYITPHIAG